MLHKALWLRSWKQTKWVLFVFLCVTLYFFPIRYYSSSVELTYSQSVMYPHLRYHYSTTIGVIGQMLLVFILAVVLMGWERRSQATDFLFVLPFTRKQIFLAKWYFGIVHIVGINAMAYGLMYVVKKTTVLDSFQDFGDYLLIFIMSVIALCAIYTVCLFVGTFMGNSVSQSVLSGFIVLMPSLLYLLGSYLIDIHQPIQENTYYKGYSTGKKIAVLTTIPAPVVTMDVTYDGMESQHFSIAPWIDKGAPLLKWLYPLCNLGYILIALFCGIRIYERIDNEKSGLFFLHPRVRLILYPVLLVLAAAFCAQIFTISISSLAPVNFYFSFVVFFLLFKWSSKKIGQRGWKTASQVRNTK